MAGSETWVRREESGDAAALHALVPDLPARRELWRLDVTAPALVLGSTQADTVDHRAATRADTSVVSRRSGGGAVLLLPGESTWVDVIVPRGDVLWDDDVTRSFFWLGEVWIDVLRRAGFGADGPDTEDPDVGGLDLGGLDLHRGGLVRGEHGAAVCFAGLGPGEVTAGGVKLVGLSQRRTRELARFQCTVHHVWRPDRYQRLLPDDLPDASVLPPVATAAVDSAVLFDTLCEVLAAL